MLKVFLVEDEFVVREGIKRNIDWEKSGFEFCGEAPDGELAYPLIQKEKPDIVITDIRMPFMDGLTLSKMVKQILPETEIIILTGHEEFEYAKEGIKIGVAEYLSKPISGEHLLQVINTVAERILEKRKELETLEKYRKEMEEDIEGEKRALFLDLMNAAKSLPELLADADKLGMNLSAVWYNVALIKMNSIKHDPEEYSRRMIQVRQQVKEMETQSGFLVFDRNIEGSAIIFMGDTEEELLDKQKEILSNMEKLLSSYEDVTYFIGVGEPVNRLREIPASFEQASHAFANRFLMKENTTLYYRDLTLSEKEETEEFSIQDVNPKQFDRTRIQEFLKTGAEDEVVYFVEEFFKNLGNSIAESKLFRQYIAMDCYFCVTEFVSELQLDKSLIEPPDMSTGILKSGKQIMKYFEKIIARAIALREQVASNRYGDVVKEVITYIEEHYRDEELSLNVIASHVNFSPNHLSMVFSQQTGQTLIKYLTDFRMNKAKEMMKCTNKKTNVIAMEVGYKDSHYFSYLFKKTQGVTPTQYRSK